MTQRLGGLIRANRKSFTIFLIVAVLLILPPSRYLLLFHMWCGSEDVTTGSCPEFTIENDRRVPRNASEALEIARRDGESTKVRSFSDMIARHPNEPALYAGLLRFYTATADRTLSYVRPDSPVRSTGPQPRRGDLTGLTRSPEMRAAENAVRMGRNLEPGNVFFDLMEAYLRYGEKRDAEALAAIRRAAGKHDFDDHVRDYTYAWLDYGPVLPFPVDQLYPVRKVLAPAMIEVGYLARLRPAIGLALIQSAEEDQILPTMYDVVRIGDVIREDGGCAIAALWGVALQKDALFSANRTLSGLLIPDESHYSPKTSEMPSLLAKLKGKSAPDTMTRVEWETVRKSIDRSVRFHRTVSPYVEAHVLTTSYTDLVMIHRVAGEMLKIVLFMAMLWTPAAIWLLARRKWRLQGLGPRAVWIWLPAVVCGLPFNLLGVDHEHFRLSTVVWTRIAVGFSGMVPFAAFLAAIFRSRISPDVGRVDTIFARLRRGSVLAIQALLVLYIATVLISIPIAVHTNHRLDAVIADEPALVWMVGP